MRFQRPSVPEEANRKQGGSDDYRWEAVLGSDGTSVLGRDSLNVPIREVSECDLAEEKADCEPKVGHAALCWGEIIFVCEDRTHGCETDERDGVGHGAVEA